MSSCCSRQRTDSRGTKKRAAGPRLEQRHAAPTAGCRWEWGVHSRRPPRGAAARGKPRGVRSCFLRRAPFRRITVKDWRPAKSRVQNIDTAWRALYSCEGQAGAVLVTALKEISVARGLTATQPHPKQQSRKKASAQNHFSSDFDVLRCAEDVAAVAQAAIRPPLISRLATFISTPLPLTYDGRQVKIRGLSSILATSPIFP